MVYKKTKGFAPVYRWLSAHPLTGIAARKAWNRGSARLSRKAVFVSGSPRSGSSWTLETLEGLVPARRHWEPIKGFQNEIGYTNGVYGGIRPFIDQSDDNPELQRRLLDSLSSERPPSQVSRMYIPRLGTFGTIGRIRNPAVTILKFTAAQRLLPWIIKSTDCKGVMVMRNPLSIVASAKKMAPRESDWGREVADSREDLKVLSRYPKVERIAQQGLSNIRYLAIRSCLDLVIPLNDQNCKESLNVVPYEKLTANPDLFFEILSALGLGDLSSASQVPNQPSATTVSDSNILKDSDPNLSWKHRLEDWEIEEVLKVMDAFDIRFYGMEPDCNIDELDRFGLRKLIA